MKLPLHLTSTGSAVALWIVWTWMPLRPRIAPPSTVTATSLAPKLIARMPAAAISPPVVAMLTSPAPELNAQMPLPFSDAIRPPAFVTFRSPWPELATWRPCLPDTTRSPVVPAVERSPLLATETAPLLTDAETSMAW